MARKFYTPIDLTGLELQNSKIQNLASDPSAYGKGHIYFNSVHNELRVYDGTQWNPVGGAVEYGNTAGRPAAGNEGRVYADTQTGTLYIDNGTNWVQIGVNAQDLADAISNAALASTDDLPEGTTNLYFTDQRAINAIDDATVTFTNKTIGDVLTFNDGLNDSSIDVTGNDLTVTANSDLFLAADGYIVATATNFNSASSNNFFKNNVKVGIDDWNENYQNGSLIVFNASGNTVFEANAGTNAVEINNENGQNFARFKTGAYEGTLDFNNYGWIKFYGGNETDEQGEIYIDGGFYLWAPSTYELGIESNDARVYITAGNNHNIDLYTGTGVVHVHTSQLIDNTLTLGGQTIDSTLTVQNAGGDEIFGVDTGANETYVRGSLIVKKTNGNQMLTIHEDGGSEAIIEAPNGDLILVADGDSYLQNNGSAANQIATKGYVDGAITGLTWKDSANLLWDDSGATLTGATGTLVIDNHAALTSANNGYRILITSGTNAGIWEYQDDTTTWTLTRPADADTYTELKGAAIFIEEGDVYGATSWVQSNHYLTSFSGQTWVQFSGQGTYTAGDGIAINGQEISVHNDDTLQFTGGALGVHYGNGINTDMSGAIQAHLGTGLTFDTGAITFDSGYGVRKYAETIGNNSSTSFSVTHNFGTRDVTVSIYDTTTYAEVFADVVHTNTNTVTVSFAIAPDTDTFRVVVVG